MMHKGGGVWTAEVADDNIRGQVSQFNARSMRSADWWFVASFGAPLLTHDNPLPGARDTFSLRSRIVFTNQIREPLIRSLANLMGNDGVDERSRCQGAVRASRPVPRGLGPRGRGG